MKANKPGFADTDLQIDDREFYPEIQPGIIQTLSRLMGFDSSNSRYRALLADVDGRLLVSTSATQGSVAVNSQVNVGVASGQVVAANASRKSVYMFNLGTVNIYVNYGNPAIVASSFPILPNTGIFEDRYLGVINAISTIAAQDLRVIEI